MVAARARAAERKGRHKSMAWRIIIEACKEGHERARRSTPKADGQTKVEKSRARPGRKEDCTGTESMLRAQVGCGAIDS
eukprot:1516006-Pleurochrysis_carterae.AAC.1